MSYFFVCIYMVLRGSNTRSSVHIRQILCHDRDRVPVWTSVALNLLSSCIDIQSLGWYTCTIRVNETLCTLLHPRLGDRPYLVKQALQVWGPWQCFPVLPPTGRLSHFPHPRQWCSLNLGEGEDRCPCMAEQSMVTDSWYSAQLWVSVLTVSYWKQLLWPGLGLVLHRLAIFKTEC